MMLYSHMVNEEIVKTAKRLFYKIPKVFKNLDLSMFGGIGGATIRPSDYKANPEQMAKALKSILGKNKAAAATKAMKGNNPIIMIGGKGYLKDMGDMAKDLGMKLPSGYLDPAKIRKHELVHAIRMGKNKWSLKNYSDPKKVDRSVFPFEDSAKASVARTIEEYAALRRGSGLGIKDSAKKIWGGYIGPKTKQNVKSISLATGAAVVTGGTIIGIDKMVPKSKRVKEKTSSFDRMVNEKIASKGKYVKTMVEITGKKVDKDIIKGVDKIMKERGFSWFERLVARLIVKRL